MNVLRASAAAHDRHTQERSNTIAEFEQKLQQLVLQRQVLDEQMEKTKREIHQGERNTLTNDLTAQMRKEKLRKERLKEDLADVQGKANQMQTSTQALMHIINSLRVTRKRHVHRVRSLDAKDHTMDNDAQFLLGTASAAMEERERLRAKHERLTLETAHSKALQLREATHLDETLAELDAEHNEIDSRLQSYDELEVRQKFRQDRQGCSPRRPVLLPHRCAKSFVRTGKGARSLRSSSGAKLTFEGRWRAGRRSLRA